MTRQIVSVAPETSILEMARLMPKNRISGLPVIDENKDLVGIGGVIIYLIVKRAGYVFGLDGWLAQTLLHTWHPRRRLLTSQKE